MRMNILPGSLWVAYTLTHPSAIQSMLPPSLRLSPVHLLGEEKSCLPSCKLLFNIYQVDSGVWMRGTRSDVLTVAQHRETGKHHLVILDCLTDTLRWDPTHGVRRGNAFFSFSSRGRRRGGGKGKHPTSSAPTLRFDMSNNRNHFSLEAVRGDCQPIDWTFAVESNLECYFGSDDTPFPMSFNHSDIMKPVRRLHPLLHHNSFWPKHRSSKPSHVFVHEHPMTFDVRVDSFLKSS